MVQCIQVKANGERCCAQAIKGEKYCLWHSQIDHIKQIRLSKAQIGGLKKRKHHDIPTADISTMELRNNPDACAQVLEIVIKSLNMNRMSPQKAGAITSAVKLMVEITEKVDLLKRIEKLEERVE